MVRIKFLQRFVREHTATMRLTTKLTVLLAVFLMLPTVLLSVLGFTAMRRQLVETETAAATAALARSTGEVQQMIGLCKASAGAAKATAETVLATGDNQLDATELYERLVLLGEANPELYAVHYYQAGAAPRRAPVLYTLSDMEKQSWCTLPYPSDSVWKFGYADQLPAKAEEPQQNLAVFLREVRTENGMFAGILEVSVPMETLFWDIYHQDQDHLVGFVDSTGAVYYDKDAYLSEWSNSIGSVVHSAAGGARQLTSTVVDTGSHKILVVAAPVPELSGHLIWAVNLDPQLMQISRMQVLFYFCLLAFFILAVFLMHYIVNRMLRRFYSLMAIAKEIQRGNFSVQVPEMGLDEIGELANDLRKTVGHIQQMLNVGVERELLVTTTEVRALQTQINAHFIYNVLESIKMMAEIKNEFEISDAVTTLGLLLRYSMKWPSSMVTLREELEYIQNYIILLNLRYDYIITLQSDVTPELLEEQIPKMALQPIVENAIYHGIEGLREDALININVRQHSGYFEVEIADSGRGMSEEALERLRRQVYGEERENPKRKGGIGLRNVHNRIRLSFGDEYGLRFEAQENRYMKVTVKLPMNLETE